MKRLVNWFNSITKRTVLSIIIVGLVLILLFSILLPSVFFFLLKSHFIENKSFELDNAASKFSFILSSYTRGHGTILRDETIGGFIAAYYSGDKADLKDDVDDYFEKRYAKNEEGVSLITYDPVIVLDDNNYLCERIAEPYVEAMLSTDWYQSYSRGDHERSYSPVITVDGYEFICYAFKYESNGLPVCSILLIDFNDFYRMLDVLTIKDFMITGHGNDILYSNLPVEQSAINLNTYPDTMFQGKQYDINQFSDHNGVNLAIRISFETENLHIVAHASKDTLLEPYRNIFFVFQLFLCVSFVILIIIMCLVLKGSLNNLKVLSKNMDKVKQGNFDTVVEINENDEIGALADTFNVMLQKINYYMEKQQEQQYIITVSEINPHFIYNTLNTITCLARYRQNDDLIEVNKALIATLKDRLKVKEYKSFDTVENEKKVLENYMLIQSHLCCSSMELSFHGSDELLQLDIPKNILQPLVENAIIHGLMVNKDEEGNVLDGKIDISVSLENEVITISVEDNGIGMSQEKMDQYYNTDNSSENTYEHIGIKNIKMRLDHLYKKQYSISVRSEKDKGTTVVIKIPKQS